MKKTFNLSEVIEITGIDSAVITSFIQREWISPQASDNIDQEDIARIHLIEELKNCFGANDESIPVILHLIDQLYYLRDQIRKAK